MSKYGPKAYNLDINQLGASNFPRFSIEQTSPYRDAVVVDVIFNEEHPLYSTEYGSNIGMVQVRMIPEDRGVPQEQLSWAMPLESSIREYPLKNEMVLIFYSVGRIFYTRRININNKITESSWPGLNEKFASKRRIVKTSEDISLAAQGGPSYRPWGASQAITLGDEFAENPSVKMVRPNEGDTIIQSRYGSVIRFGSSLFSKIETPTPQPNLLLTVGQSFDRVTSTKNPSVFSLAVEDINKDGSCIWMVTDEEIVLNPATKGSIAHLRSTESSDSNNYFGTQIFVNSDRVILNSRRNEISLFAKREINLSAVESITLDSNSSVRMTATNDVKIQAEGDVLIKGRTISFITTKDISYGTSGNYVISGKKIFIGSAGDTSQPMVLGGELSRWLQNLLDAFIVEIPKSFSTLNPYPFIQAITKLRTQLGLPTTPQSAIFNSTSNFTSKTN